MWPENALGTSIIVPKQVYAGDAYEVTAKRQQCWVLDDGASTANLCWVIHNIIQCWVNYGFTYSEYAG